MKLRPYQEAGVEKFLARPEPQRMFLSWALGAGKTFGAMACVGALNPSRALFIVPAMVRPTWAKLLTEAFPDREVCSIFMGRSTRSGTKKSLEQRDRAYAAPWQLVSYDLVSQVDPGPWDFIVIDEVHNLRNPLSVQSKAVRARVLGNPNAACLGLSATLIPNEARNVWCPLDTFFPGEFGEPSRTGDVSWAFLARYCHKEVNSYGTRYFGLRPESRPKLAAALEPISHRVVEADFAAYLPPLFVEPLVVEKMPKDTAKWALEWVEQQIEQPKVGVFTHLRETARAVADALSTKYPQIPVLLMMGDTTVEKRAELLQASRDAERCFVVGTTHALNEGVSLSHLKAALVLEWQTAMGDILQFLGRFARQDSATQAPTRVQLLVGPDDETRMQTLRDRIEAFTAVFKAGRTENLATEAFKAAEVTDEELARALAAVVTEADKRAKYKGFQDESEEEEEDGDEED